MQIRSLIHILATILLFSLSACGGGGSDNTASGSNVATLAGDGTADWADGTGTAARFNRPKGTTTHGIDLYVADDGNNRVRRIVIATGEVATFIGDGTSGQTDGIGQLATLNGPKFIATDGTNLYLADNNEATSYRQIVIATGAVTTLAGGSGRGFVEGPGNLAQFNEGGGMAVDGGNLYVADAGNHRIRQIEIATGQVSTFAGDGIQGAQNGIGGAARFNAPVDITSDGTKFYVTDLLNHLIRKIVIATGEVTTMAGDGTPGTLDGTGTNAQFNEPFGITADSVNLYVTERGNDRVRQIEIATGVVTTLAGSSTGYADGDYGISQFNGAWGITTDGINLYIGDTENHRIRRVRLP